ncbi:MAG: hypothetical protein E6R13_01230 [Spirochaetes bacterium]|nr:MAG: hypothetical protein E6R13_01230 [Spirochaetota bacterium]
MLIYVDFEIPDNPRDFIRKLFTCKNMYDRVSCVRTFADKELKVIQCQINKQRSFDEIFFCTKTYFSKITPKEVLHILLTLRVHGQERNVYIPYLKHCAGIKKINFLYYRKDINSSEIFSKSYAKYDSIWSWKELLAQLNINNLEEMLSYIKTNIEDPKQT